MQGASQLEAGDCGYFIVVATGEAIGCGAAKEGADQAASRWNAVRELLVGEGAGEQEAGGGIEGALRMRVVGRHEEAEAGRKRDAAGVGVAECDQDRGTGFGGEQFCRSSVERGDQLPDGAERRGEEDGVEGIGGEVAAGTRVEGPGWSVGAIVGLVDRGDGGVESEPLGRNGSGEAIDEGAKAGAQSGED